MSDLVDYESDFKEVFTHIKWEVSKVFFAYSTYKELYAKVDEERLRIYQDTAPGFFLEHKASLLDWLLLTVSRLLDSSHYEAENEIRDNLSFMFLIGFKDLQEIRGTLEEKMARINEAFLPLRPYRDRILLHNDALVYLEKEPLPGYPIDKLDILLKELECFINRIEESLGETETAYSVFYRKDGAPQLLLAINDAYEEIQLLKKVSDLGVAANFDYYMARHEILAEWERRKKIERGEILVNPNVSDVFILGAGFSKSVFPRFPTVKELSAEISTRLRTQGDLLANDPFVEELIGSNFEQALTYLSDSQPWLPPYRNYRNIGDFKNLNQCICLLLYEKCGEYNYEFLRQPSNDNHWIRKLVDLWHRSKSSIITFNYDTLIEKTALDSELRNDEGSVVSFLIEDFYRAAILRLPQNEEQRIGPNPNKTFGLYKLHGSINWYYSGADPFRGQPVYCDEVWDHSTTEERSAYLSGKTHLVAPPTVNKSPYINHEMFDYLWESAGKKISEAKRLIFWGYSLPLTDLSIRNFISEFAQNGTEIVIVNSDRLIENKYRNVFRDMRTDFVYITFSGSKCVEEFLAAYK